jgi:HSP20 family protein
MGNNMNLFEQLVKIKPLERNVNDLIPDFVPSINIQETADGYHLEAELPGVQKEDVEVLVKGDCLVLRGKKKGLNDEAEGRYFCIERESGDFYRSIPIPLDVDKDKIIAELKDGVLRVDIKKSSNMHHTDKKIVIN